VLLLAPGLISLTLLVGPLLPLFGDVLMTALSRGVADRKADNVHNLLGDGTMDLHGIFLRSPQTPRTLCYEHQDLDATSMKIMEWN
jgi:hypothetical protein